MRLLGTKENKLNFYRIFRKKNLIPVLVLLVSVPLVETKTIQKMNAKLNLVPAIEFIAALGGIEGCRFASLTYTAKESGETARHTVLLGFSYRKAVEKSLLELEIQRPSLTGIDAIAADELIESFKKTLAGTQDGYTKANVYVDTAISGLKVNTNDNSLQLFGLVQNKVVLVPGVFKEVKSAPKTIAKNKLRKELPVGKFREYAIDSGSIHAARVNGEVIEF